MEVSSAMPLNDPSFLPCQTLKGHLRYKTAELVELDNKRFAACEKVKKMEVEEMWNHEIDDSFRRIKGQHRNGRSSD